MGALPNPKSSPLVKQVQKIRGEIESLLLKMQKSEQWTPTREQMDDCAELLVRFVNKNPVEVEAHKSYLKAAIIDLTEVPQMAQEMQRIAYSTAIKSALNEIDLFLSCL